MEAETRARLLRAIALHQDGALDPAITLYEEVLARNPRSFDALRLLGAARLARHDPAGALLPLEAATGVRADFAEAWALRADALGQLGRHGEAASCYETALRLRPGNPGGWNNLGLQYQALGRAGEALAAFDRALALAPQIAVVWTNRGVCLGQLGRHGEAADSHARGLAHEPGNAAIWCNHGQALHDARRHDDALASYEKALALAPAAPQALIGRGAVLRALGRTAAALEDSRSALAVRGDDVVALGLHGALLADLQRHEEAVQCFDRALERDPQNAEIQFNRGLAQLTLGRFPQAWAGYEWRRKVARFAMGAVDGLPEWDGSESLRGMRLLLVCEQGLGDALQFVRFVPLLAARGARIHLAVRAPLRPLLEQGLAGLEQLVVVGEPLPPVDRQLPLLSVPLRLGLLLEDVPAQVPYVRAPAAAHARWRAALAAGGAAPRARIGLVCSGNPEHGNDHNRSIELLRLAPLIRQMREHGCTWHLLQDRVRPGDAAALESLGIVDHHAALTDLGQTAGLLACLDAVVTVDTAVAHLAGALAVPVLTLLPTSSDWRWLLGRPDSPWYPTMRLFRQQRPGDWTEPLAAVGAALLERLGPIVRSGEPPPAQAPATAAGTGTALDIAACLAGARALHEAGQHGPAMDHYRSVLALDPRHFNARRLLGAALLQLGRPGEALAELDRALALDADQAEPWHVRGRALAELGRHEEALASLDRALELGADGATLWTDHGHQLQALGRHAAAQYSFEQAVRVAPDSAQGRFHLAVARLQQGDFARGWPDYEARRRIPEMAMQAPLDCPFWDGRESLQGRRLLVCAEQGLGDTLQFCRYLERLTARGAEVLLGVQAPLRRLLASLPGAVRLVVDGEALPAVDRQCWLLSVPGLLGLAAESLAGPVPYLHAAVADRRSWEERLGPRGRGPDGRPCRRIGVVCSGNPQHVNDRARSLPLAQFARLALPGVELHLLQWELRPTDEAAMGSLGIIDHRVALRAAQGDFAQTAALAACMDAVVSVDTAPAHLAGALGLPLHLLLPANPDWRWQLDRRDSPWYPSAHLYRQRPGGPWDEPLAEIRDALAAM